MLANEATKLFESGLCKYIYGYRLIYHTVCIYCIAGNFRYLAPERSAKIFMDLIFAFQSQETTPINSFACEILVRGSFNFRVFC